LYPAVALHIGVKLDKEVTAPVTAVKEVDMVIVRGLSVRRGAPKGAGIFAQFLAAFGYMKIAGCLCSSGQSLFSKISFQVCLILIILRSYGKCKGARKGMIMNRVADLHLPDFF